MELEISITCESYEEALTHLSKIRQEFKKQYAKSDEETDFAFEDHNCYGDHSVKVKFL